MKILLQCEVNTSVSGKKKITSAEMSTAEVGINTNQAAPSANEQDDPEVLPHSCPPKTELLSSAFSGSPKIELRNSAFPSSQKTELQSPEDNLPRIVMNAEFSSFLDLRAAIERYQKEQCVQLIVKDSKLLKAESTRKIILKVYHLVKQELMYHSITYCCKCHGELKQKPGTRIKNVGQKRLNCPMFLRFKLSSDLQKLVLYDLNETHNHGIDPTTFQLPPRQRAYRLSRKTQRENDTSNEAYGSARDHDLLDSDSDCQPPKKSARLSFKKGKSASRPDRDSHDEDDHASDSDSDSLAEEHPPRPDSPLDPDSSCSDSDAEEIRINQALLPFPLRLIGSAALMSPELLADTKQLIQIQKTNLLIQKQKLLLEMKQLELTNSKLELEIRALERNLSAEMSSSSSGRDTTIYLQTI